MCMTLELGADDWDSLAQALRALAHRCEYEPGRSMDSTRGGWDSGWHCTITEDETMTGERFRGELEQWRQARVAARREGTP